MSSRQPIETIQIRGISFSRVDEATTVQWVLDSLEDGEGGWVCPVNLEVLRQCLLFPDVAELVGTAEVVVADGAPLIWASVLQGQSLPGRVAGSTLLMSLTEAAARHSRSVYLLGGGPGAAERAAARLRRDSPSLSVAGVHCPPFGFEFDPVERVNLESRLTAAAPDIVFVGLGFPKQDLLIADLRSRFPATYFVSCGISFSFAAGMVARAPRLLQALGLEWVHRLVQEPRRLSRRYIVYGIPFGLRLLFSSAKQRLQRSVR